MLIRYDFDNDANTLEPFIESKLRSPMVEVTTISLNLQELSSHSFIMHHHLYHKTELTVASLVLIERNSSPLLSFTKPNGL